MTADQRREYAETVGLVLLEDLAPLDGAEYALLRDAVVTIERQRLLDRGVSDADARALLGLLDDWFAFEAAART